MEKEESQLISGFFVVIFLIVVVRNAWISDDAYISFRAIENLIAGYGFNFNPFVRVQVYTHPLWALLISTAYFFQTKVLGFSKSTGLYLLVIFLSIFISTFAIYVVFKKLTKNTFISKLLIGVSIISSKAFIDYSTSGLENPLTYLLLAIFLIIFLNNEEKLLDLVFCAALLAVNRQDTILLVMPALLFRFISIQKNWKSKFSELILGFSPLILWELFSLFYYGFAFPNTAYAKLNTGISKASLIAQGIDYFINSITFDPVTLMLIAFTGIAIFIEKEKKAIFAYMGVLLYLVYVLSIGGDFMSGRFFSAPFFVAIILISRISFNSKQTFATGLIIIMLVVAFSEHSPIKSITAGNSADKNILENAGDLWRFREFTGKSGIADEKRVYFGSSGLTEYGVRQAEGGSEYAGNQWIFNETKEVAVATTLGLFAYKVGPNVFALDPVALTDPLLARLPTNDKKHWRIGHFERNFPDGYLITLETGEMKIEDENLALYYQKLSYVISGPLWDKERLIEILKFNSGQYNYLITSYLESGSH